MWNHRRKLLPSLSLLLLSLLPGAARAALAIETLVIAVEVEGTKALDNVFEVTFTVTGTELGQATVTPEGGSAVVLSCSGGVSCTTTQVLASQAALDALLPTTAKSYTVTLTGLAGAPPPTVTDTFSFARPSVPSPAISAPVHDSTTVTPGLVEVLFTACPGTSCSLDSLASLLEGTTLLEGALLPVGETSWEPATELETATLYTVQLTHQTGGMLNLTADGVGGGTDDDAYVLTFSVQHSDRVSFTTADPPTGSVCILVNDSGTLDTSDCDVVSHVDDSGSGILDTSHACTTEAGGIPIEYAFQLAPNGAFLEGATAEFDGITVPMKGRLRGRDGVLRQRHAARFDDGAGTRLALRIREEATLTNLSSLTWTVEQSLRGKGPLGKVDDTTVTQRMQPPPPMPPAPPSPACNDGPLSLGWKLRFELEGIEGSAFGSFEREGGEPISLAGGQRFDPLTNEASVGLESAGANRGVRLRIRRFTIDEGTLEASGVIHFRAYGQSGTLVLP